MWRNKKPSLDEGNVHIGSTSKWTRKVFWFRQFTGSHSGYLGDSDCSNAKQDPDPISQERDQPQK